MEHKQESTKKSKTSKIIWITIVAILVVLIIVVLVLKLNKKTNNVENIDTSLLGTYSYEGDTKYKFDKNGRGSLSVGKDKYSYSYKIEDSKLIIDFDDEHVHDATYSYQLDNNSLKLIGEEGTAGGEYILYKD